jgi:hypothetical protein
MKKIASLLFLLGSLCVGHAQESRPPIVELMGQGIVDPKQNLQEDMNSPLQADVSVPVGYLYTAAGPSLRLEDLYAIRALQKYQLAGNPVIIVTSAPLGAATEEMMAAKANSQKIAGQFRTLLGSKVTIYSEEELDLTVTMRQVVADASQLKMDEEMLRNGRLVDYLTPLHAAYGYAALAQRINATGIIVMGAEKEAKNLQFAKQVLQNQGVNSATLLLRKPPMAQLDRPIYLNDPAALANYVDKLSDDQLKQTWLAVANGPMPTDPVETRAQLKAQLIEMATKLNQPNQ